jgi:hypothetical protein
MFYTMTEVFSSLPQAVILHAMANLEPIVKEWHAAESNIRYGESQAETAREAAKVKAADTTK